MVQVRRNTCDPSRFTTRIHFLESLIKVFEKYGGYWREDHLQNKEHHAKEKDASKIERGIFKCGVTRVK